MNTFTYIHIKVQVVLIAAEADLACGQGDTAAIMCHPARPLMGLFTLSDPLTVLDFPTVGKTIWCAADGGVVAG